MKAIPYHRVSTDKQDMERQLYFITQYCDKGGLHLMPAISDPDTSGSVPFAEREGGAQLLAIITQAREPYAIVTTEQDRIGRDTADQILTIRTFWMFNAIPHFAAEGGALPRTPENEMRMEIRASLGQYERNKIRQRITNKMDAKFSNGELCGTVPYGFAAVPTGRTTAKGVAIQKLVDNPDEQKWILHMKTLRDTGLGYHSIAKDLNSRGVPTKRGAGEVMNLRIPQSAIRNPQLEKPVRRFTSGRWQAGNVCKVLNNKTVMAWLAGRAVADAA